METEACNRYSPIKYESYYAESYKAYSNKYSSNPFKKNTDYEMSVRRLSYTNNNGQCLSCKEYNDYHGYPRSTMQITIRVECRIYTWYVRVHHLKRIDFVRIMGEVDSQEVAIIT